jgi:hypothetical protein
MEVLPVRLPESLAEAVAWVARRESVDRSTALRKLLASGLDRYVADAYARGEISLREAAGWLGLSVREALDRLADLGVPSNASAESVRAALDALRELER